MANPLAFGGSVIVPKDGCRLCSVYSRILIPVVSALGLQSLLFYLNFLFFWFGLVNRKNPSPPPLHGATHDSRHEGYTEEEKNGYVVFK